MIRHISMRAPCRRPRHAGFLLAVLLVVATSSQAGAGDTRETDYSVNSWTIPVDVAPGPFYAVTQDSYGYIWFTAARDVVRFDGVRFVELEDLDRNLKRSNAIVSALGAARDGSVWIGRRDGTVTRIRDANATTYSDRGPGVGAITALVEGRDGTIWSAGRSGLATFRDNDWKRAASPDGSVDQPVTSLFADRQGSLWAATRAGIFVQRASSPGFQAFQTTSTSIQGFAEDSTGTIWVTDPAAGVRMLWTPHPSSAQAARIGPEQGVRLLTDRRGNLWLATNGQGLWRFSTDQSQSPSIEHFTKANGLTSNRVLSLFEDREGNIWVGTENGLLTLRQRGPISSLPVVSAHQLTATPDGSVWIGTPAGLLQYTQKGMRRWTRRDGLPSDAITALSEGAAGPLLVVTDRGLAEFTNGHFIPVPLPAAAAQIVSLTNSAQGLLLCDSELALRRFSNGSLQSIPEIGSRPCRVTFADHKGRLWVGFVDGAVALFEAGQVQMYSQGSGLSGGTVTIIYEDDSGSMWFGTNQGLSLFVKGAFVTFSEAAGLPPKSVFSILDDGGGHLWCATLAGIIRIDRTEFDRAMAEPAYRMHYVLYDSGDGLDGSPQFLGYPKATRSLDGRLWFGTTNGVSIANPRQLTSDEPPPSLIEGVTANGTRLQSSSDLTLSSSLHELRFDYTALAFASPHKTRFRYILEGFDREWVDAGPRRQAIYTNLTPGRYKFRVTASSGGNNWNKAGSVLAFYVPPPFYRTTSFLVVAVAAALTAVYCVWWLRLRKVKNDLAIVYAERTRLAREIHDTLLQSLVGVAVQFEVIAQRLESSPALAKEHLRRVRDDVEQYIREARTSIWDLRSPILQTRDLCLALRSVCRNVSVGQGVPCEFVAIGTPRRINLRSEEHILRICHEAMTNAVRHAKATHIRVELSYSLDLLALRIVDDGVGFTPAAESDENWGLMNMRERAEELHGRFTITSAAGRGTQIEVEVPLTTEVNEPRAAYQG